MFSGSGIHSPSTASIRASRALRIWTARDKASSRDAPRIASISVRSSSSDSCIASTSFSGWTVGGERDAGEPDHRPWWARRDAAPWLGVRARGGLRS
jgi:hypothetical protein